MRNAGCACFLSVRVSKNVVSVVGIQGNSRYHLHKWAERETSLLRLQESLNIISSGFAIRVQYIVMTMLAHLLIQNWELRDGYIRVLRVILDAAGRDSSRQAVRELVEAARVRI